MLHMICMERVKSFLMLINIVFHLASYKSANTIISHFMWDFLKILDSRGLLKGRSQVTSKTGNYKFKQLCFFPAQYRQCAQSVRNGTTEKHRKFAKKRMEKNHGKKSYKATAKQVIFAKFPFLFQSRQCAKSARNGMTAKHQKVAKARTRVKIRRRSNQRRKLKKAKKTDEEKFIILGIIPGWPFANIFGWFSSNIFLRGLHICFLYTWAQRWLLSTLSLSLSTWRWLCILRTLYNFLLRFVKLCILGIFFENETNFLLLQNIFSFSKILCLTVEQCLSFCIGIVNFVYIENANSSTLLVLFKTVVFTKVFCLGVKS